MCDPSLRRRRKFGALGWNIPYAFTTSDLECCVTQIQQFVDEYEVVPYQVLRDDQPPLCTEYD